MKLLKKGAEGDVFLTSWNSKKSIFKSRKKKDFRNPQLDLKIRKQRTIKESEIISFVKSLGVRVPLIYFVNSKDCTITMQYIPGKLVRDLSKNKIISCCAEIGHIVGKLHKNGIMHGDLTTSNFILNNDKIFLIDFGLSIKTEKLEDFAIDLRLFKEILNSAHASILTDSWDNFLKNYKKIIGTKKFKKIHDLVSVIESRGRYANVT